MSTPELALQSAAATSETGERLHPTKLRWAAFGLGCLLFFSVVSFPMHRVRAFIQGSAMAALSQYGISYSAEKTKLSLWFGVTYTLEKVTLLPSGAKFSEIRIQPSLLGFLTGKQSASIRLQGEKQGTVWISAGIKSETVSGDLEFENFEIEPWVIFAGQAMGTGASGFALPRMTGTLNGSADFSAPLKRMKDLEADVKLKLTKLETAETTIAGFQIPRLSIQTGEVNLKAQAGKVQFQEVHLGKSVNTDSLVFELTGSLTLEQVLMNSQWNARARFAFSPALPKTLTGALEVFLISGKQNDGFYLFNVTGPMEYVQWAPVPPTAGP